MKTCANCGAMLLDGENNCPKCGAPSKTEFDQGTANAQNVYFNQNAGYNQQNNGNFNQNAGYNQQYNGNYNQNSQSAPPFGNIGTDHTAEYDINDIRENKWCYIIAYFGILFFLPLVVYPNSRVGRFHANQALIQLILGVVIGLVNGVMSGLRLIPGMWTVFFVLSTIISTALGLVELFIFIFELVNILNDKVVEVPVIGKFRLIK